MGAGCDWRLLRRATKTDSSRRVSAINSQKPLRIQIANLLRLNNSDIAKG
jgi:hypothetical protein